MARNPTPTQTDWEKNGMSEAEWNALSPDAQAWRREHPDQREHPQAAVQARPSSAAAPMARQAEAPVGGEHRDPPVVAGAQVVLTGDAKAAARGDLHGSIVENQAARDAAIADGHVAPDTAPTAVAETLAASVGAAVETDPKQTADLEAARRAAVADRARAGGEAVRK